MPSEIWFKDDDHETSFKEMCHKGRFSSGREPISALYVLAAIGKDEIQQHVFPGEIDFPTINKKSVPWSSGERALVKLAATLYNSIVWPVSVFADVFDCLDQNNFKVAIEALKIRYER